MTNSELIHKSDKILYSTSYLDKIMYKRLLKYLASHSIGGNVSLSNEDLATLEDVLYKEIKDSGYNADISQYLALFSKIDDIVSDEQLKHNNIKRQAIKDLWNDSAKKKAILDKVVYDLGQQGVKDVYIKGLAKLVRDASFFNLTIDDAIDRIEDKIINKGYTEAYIRQTAIDSISQYKGAINDEVRIAYELTDMLYISNIIETSRPICTHIRNDLKGRVTSEQLKIVLEEYCPNGVPSDKKITFTTVDETRTIRKGAGMIEGTRFENFAQNRGGYQCRHEAIFVRKKA